MAGGRFQGQGKTTHLTFWKKTKEKTSSRLPWKNESLSCCREGNRIFSFVSQWILHWLPKKHRCSHRLRNLLPSTIKFRKYVWFWGDQEIHLAYKVWGIKIKKIFTPKIILHNYILLKGDPAHIEIFQVNLRMDMIFTDFPTGSGSSPCTVLKICNVHYA